MEERIFEVGQRVRFVRAPKNDVFRPHFELSRRYLDLGMIYEVSHYFHGEPAQIEIKGLEPLFAAEMFDLVP